MDFLQIVQTHRYAILVFIVVMGFSFVFNVRQRNRMKSKSKNFLSRHPQAAKVYLTQKGMIVTESVEVYSVNGEEPAQFTEGATTRGFYVLPGKTTVQISYTYTRPGVMHKTVSESTDVVEKVLETKPYKAYVLGFDRKEECFTFEETQG